jgi:peptidoglycan/LPS O-acetylase OafA/YrhL
VKTDKKDIEYSIPARPALAGLAFCQYGAGLSAYLLLTLLLEILVAIVIAFIFYLTIERPSLRVSKGVDVSEERRV